MLHLICCVSSSHEGRTIKCVVDVAIEGLYIVASSFHFNTVCYYRPLYYSTSITQLIVVCLHGYTGHDFGGF